MNKKKILFLVIALLLIVCIDFLYSKYKGKYFVIDENQKIESEHEREARIKREKIAMELQKIIDEGKIYNEEYDMLKSVIKTQNADLCLKLKEQKNIDSCIERIVSVTNEVNKCDAIQGQELKVKCHESEKFISTDYQNIDIDYCYAFNYDTFKKACLNTLFSSFLATSSCGSLVVEEDKVKCLDIVKNNLSHKEGDKEYCNSISTEALKRDCIKKDVKLDTDNDGLSDDQEMSYGLDISNPDSDGDGLIDGDEIYKYKTNPLNPDTDNDGHTDGDEVKNGFNPNGEGELVE